MVIVIEPLVSIMEEQVKKLASYGYSVAQVGKDDEIRSGRFTFLFASPELLLGNEEWRNMLRSSCYQEKRILIVIDEAHTVIEWYV
jgi:superfamily II DNA helicase RecQ